MKLRSRHLLVLASLVLLLCVAGGGLALASPDGDDDPAYNAGPSAGTQYSAIPAQFEPQAGSHPVTTQDQSQTANAGSSVSAALVAPQGSISLGDDSTRGGQIQPTEPLLQLTRYDANGQPVASFGGSDDGYDVAPGVRIAHFPDFTEDLNIVELLDIRVVSGGNIRVLALGSDDEGDDHLLVVDYDGTTGELVGSGHVYAAPDEGLCGDSSGDIASTRGGPPLGLQDFAYLDAARVASDGSVSALWDCDVLGGDVLENAKQAREKAVQARSASNRLQEFNESEVYVGYYAPDAAEETSHTFVDTAGDHAYGQDLELGPNDEPYALTGSFGDDENELSTKGASQPGEYSQVFHFKLGQDQAFTTSGAKAARDGNSDLIAQDPTEGSDPNALPALPVDLAVDHQGRPVVWIDSDSSGSFNEWGIYRLTGALATDTGWGSGGKAAVTEPRLGEPASFFGVSKTLPSLTVRPDNRVLASGPSTDQPTILQPLSATRSTPKGGGNSGQSSTAIIAGLTNTGGTDTGFGDASTPGFKALSFTVGQPSSGDLSVVNGDYQAIGEPKVQSDGKVFVPHTSSVTTIGPVEVIHGQRSAAPPAGTSPGTAYFAGVTRLRLNPSSGSSPGQPTALSPSSVPAQCGRRIISLVRADVRGRKIRLTGLVGAGLYGKTVTIETNPTAVKASAYSRTTTVKASKTGAFTATVKAPAKQYFKTVRYRAKSGRATSPVLKLPQSLTSRSVKSAKGTITVKGQVKRSVLGKRNSVKIRRLVCGRYRTVAVVKPSASGAYTATFKATKIRGVSFYRAEASVQVKPGSKKYATQYARAIAIRTTSQTG